MRFRPLPRLSPPCVTRVLAMGRPPWVQGSLAQHRGGKSRPCRAPADPLAPVVRRGLLVRRARNPRKRLPPRLDRDATSSVADPDVASRFTSLLPRGLLLVPTVHGTAARIAARLLGRPAPRVGRFACWPARRSVAASRGFARPQAPVRRSPLPRERVPIGLLGYGCSDSCSLPVLAEARECESGASDRACRGHVGFAIARNTPRAAVSQMAFDHLAIG